MSFPELKISQILIIFSNFIAVRLKNFMIYALLFDIATVEVRLAPIHVQEKLQEKSLNKICQNTAFVSPVFSSIFSIFLDLCWFLLAFAICKHQQ